jgi:hypothetical protein
VRPDVPGATLCFVDGRDSGAGKACHHRCIGSGDTAHNDMSILTIAH